NALILALLIPTGGAHMAEAGPTCRAELKGVNLLTVVELPNGLVVEGPWRIDQHSSGNSPFGMIATLDHVIERDALTGSRNVIPFPEPVQLAFEGKTQEEVVQRAARVWCVTVMRAQENQRPDQLSEPTAARITALPHDVNAG